MAPRKLLKVRASPLPSVWTALEQLDGRCPRAVAACGGLNGREQDSKGGGDKRQRVPAILWHCGPNKEEEECTPAAARQESEVAEDRAIRGAAAARYCVAAALRMLRRDHEEAKHGVPSMANQPERVERRADRREDRGRGDEYPGDEAQERLELSEPLRGAEVEAELVLETLGIHAPHFMHVHKNICKSVNQVRRGCRCGATG